jgi:hypothetical protein
VWILHCAGEDQLETAASVELQRFNLTTVSVGWRSPAFFAPGDAAGDILAHLPLRAGRRAASS